MPYFGFILAALAGVFLAFGLLYSLCKSKDLEREKRKGLVQKPS
jgi:hypothetical protein